MHTNIIEITIPKQTWGGGIPTGLARRTPIVSQ